jgi:hypothetical protein
MQSKLRQVLTVFETADSPLSLPQIARDLDIPPDRLEGMIQHWVRRGKIRETGSPAGCGSCGHQTGCPFVMEMPRRYELAYYREENISLLPVTQCGPSKSCCL